jgi:DNA polymerase V
MNKEIYALIDCNNFYASCERVFQPNLNGKPIGILSNNDGCIVAMSKEMKDLGITRGVPYFQIKHLIQKHNIKIFSSNYSLYGDMSARVMKTLATFSPEIEIYSIDEAFLLLSGFTKKNMINYGHEIRQTVFKWTGIPVSVGIGRTKTLAKIAEHIAKKYTRFQNVFDITDHPHIEKILTSIPVEKIWGVGYQYAKMLHKYGFHNVHQLIQAPDDWIKKRMSIVGLRTVKELRGISCLDLETDMLSRKQIVSSRSFGKPVTTLQELQEAAAAYCTRAVEKLREQDLVASQVMVYLTTNRFKEEPQYANFISGRLAVPSAFTPDFLIKVKELLNSIYRQGYHYKKVGIMISDIIHQKKAPLDFFAPCYLDDKRKIIMDKMDNINRRWGSGTLRFAASGTEQKWSMRREFLSPRYTTCWKELPIVNADCDGKTGK